MSHRKDVFYKRLRKDVKLRKLHIKFKFYVNWGKSLYLVSMVKSLGPPQRTQKFAEQIQKPRLEVNNTTRYIAWKFNCYK